MSLLPFFVFGLFLGSFFNTVALRSENDEPILFSRSKCPKCGKILKFYNLIPVLSYLAQSGKCSNCHQKISIRYPLVEIFTGFFVYQLASILSFNVVFQSFVFYVLFFYYLIFLSVFFILALIDFKTKYIDERVIYFVLIFWVIFQITFFKFFASGTNPAGGFLSNGINFTGSWSYFFSGFLHLSDSEFLNQLFTGFLGALPFVFLFLITLGRGVGFGDAKVAFMMGLFLKPGDLIFSFISSIILGGVISVLIFFRNKKLKQEIPYVPFLFLGTLIVMFWGEKIISYYFKIIQ